MNDSPFIPPANDPFAMDNSPIQRISEDIGRLAAQHIDELLTESLKDLNGGLMPNDKAKRRHLRRSVHPDGQIFHWKGRPILWVSPAKLVSVADGKMQLHIKHKQIYKHEPEPVISVTNN